MITLKIDGRDTLAELDRIIDGLEIATLEGLEAVAIVGQAEAARLAGGGRLGKSIGVFAAPGGFDLEATAPYATWVEHGRGPVHAKGSGFLRFEIGGQIFFRRSVGAAKAKPFMAPTFPLMDDSNLVERSLSQLIGGA